MNNQSVCSPEETKKTVPGPRSYSDALVNGSETLIVGTSMVRGLRMKEVNESFHGVGHISREKFHGGKVRHIKDYITTHLREKRPETVLLQIGSNDIPTPRSNPVPMEEIA